MWCCAFIISMYHHRATSYCLWKLSLWISKNFVLAAKIKDPIVVGWKQNKRKKHTKQTNPRFLFSFLTKEITQGSHLMRTGAPHPVYFIIINLWLLSRRLNDIYLLLPWRSGSCEWNREVGSIKGQGGTNYELSQPPFQRFPGNYPKAIFPLYFFQWSSIVEKFEKLNTFIRYTDSSYKYVVLLLRKKQKWIMVRPLGVVCKKRKNDKRKDLCTEVKRVYYRQLFYEKDSRNCSAQANSMKIGREMRCFSHQACFFNVFLRWFC